MSNPYLRLLGRMTAASKGLKGASEAHREFLSSGYVCPGCRRTLMHWWGFGDVNLYSQTGEKVPLLNARRDAKTAECPHCRFKWELRE